MKSKALIKYLYLFVYIVISFLIWTFSFYFAGIGLFIFIIVGAFVISFFYGILSYVITKKIIIPSCLFTVALATYLLFAMEFNIVIAIFALLCGAVSFIVSLITFALHKLIKKMLNVKTGKGSMS